MYGENRLRGHSIASVSACVSRSFLHPKGASCISLWSHNGLYEAKPDFGYKMQKPWSERWPQPLPSFLGKCCWKSKFHDLSPNILIVRSYTDIAEQHLPHFWRLPFDELWEPWDSGFFQNLVKIVQKLEALTNWRRMTRFGQVNLTQARLSC